MWSLSTLDFMSAIVVRQQIYYASSVVVVSDWTVVELSFFK